MIQVVPVFAKDDPRFNTPQGCWFRSVWFGDISFNFASKDVSFLQDEALQSETYKIICAMCEAVGISDASDLSAIIGKDGDYNVWCSWDDFVPACQSMALHQVVIQRPNA